MMDHTLPQLPPVFDATADTIVSDAEAVIKRTNDVWNKICANLSTSDATFDNAILPIIRDENVKLVRTRLIAFYPSVATSKALREATREATKLLNASDIVLYSRVDMFQLVNSVNLKAQNGVVDLDPESRHYLTKLRRKFIENGCNIDDPNLKHKFSLKLTELKRINSQVSQNFHEETAGVWFTKEELAGVPESLMGRFRRGSGEYEDRYWVSTKTPFSTPVLRYADLEETRKKMFYAVKNRLPENVSLFRQLVLLRDDIARMLGYAHHLAFTTSQKAAQTPEFVYSLLNELREKIEPAAAQNAQELLHLKIATLGQDNVTSDEVKLCLWDQMYFANKQMDDIRPNQERVSQYFELYHTLERILNVLGGLLDTRFELITAERQTQIGAGRPLTWHEDVLLYAVWNTRDEAFLGYAYFDLFSRDGKYTHNGHYALNWVSSKCYTATSL